LRDAVGKERNEAGWQLWDEVRAGVANRQNWKHFLDALCAKRHKEDMRRSVKDLVK